jgi:hypothetical protein
MEKQSVVSTIKDAKIKEIVWKLDRDVWANVQKEEWTTSKGREESAKLIAEYFGTVEEARHKEMNRWRKIIDAQRIQLSAEYELPEMSDIYDILDKHRHYEINDTVFIQMLADKFRKIKQTDNHNSLKS